MYPVVGLVRSFMTLAGLVGLFVPKRIRPVVLAWSLAFICVPVLAAEPRHVNVSTIKGDTVEGSLKGLTDTDLILEVAGQDLRLPLGTLKIISLVGKIDEANSKGRSPLEEALTALGELRAATEIGMLREQYSQKLLETLPRVRAFTKTATGWDDVKLAMERAILQYQEPLKDLESWKNAGIAMTVAAFYADYAADLAKRPGEESHVEAKEEREVRIGEPAKGRLGVGDRTMPRELDRSSAEAFNDVLKVTVSNVTQATIVMTSSGAYYPHLTLTDQSGRKIEGDAGFSGTSKIKQQLKPGTYYIWAGASSEGAIGEYNLDWQDHK
jgi:hypothetical protein